MMDALNRAIHYIYMSVECGYIKDADRDADLGDLTKLRLALDRFQWSARCGITRGATMRDCGCVACQLVGVVEGRKGTTNGNR